MLSKSIIKYIQSLQHKKFRDEHNAFIAEGPKVVGELIQSKRFECKNLYAAASWISSNVNNLPVGYRSRITEVKEFELEKIASMSTPNLVIAEFHKKHTFEKLSLKGRISLMLDDINDPGNFGTIIRTADWFGIENIICSRHTVDMYNPKVVQSTMASLGNVNILYADLEDLIKKNPEIRTYASVLKGTPVREIGKIREGFVIIGNESKGISNTILDIAKEKITIPKYGSAESLNAGVATGIILYDLKG